MTPPKIRILVLKHLAERPLSGYSLIREIREHTGWSPSYGSMYPLLERLRKDGLVTFRKRGRSKLFSLTAKGTSAYAEMRQHHDEIIGKIREAQRLMCHVCDVQQDPLLDLFTQAGNGRVPLQEILKEGYALKSELARLWTAGHWDANATKVNAILRDATAKLRRLQ